MDADTQITLDQFYAAVTADIREAFPDFATVEFDREDRTFKAADLPACLLEISEFEDADEHDPGTEQWATVARIEARVILGFRLENVKLEVRKAATALSVWLRRRRFRHPTRAGKALPTGQVMLAGCYKDDFSPDLDEFEVWRVEWSQTMHLGVSVFQPGEAVPWQPVYSWVPDVGFGHEDDYRGIPVPEGYTEAAQAGGTDRLVASIDQAHQVIHHRMGFL